MEMTMMEEMLAGAGFTLENVNGNRADVEVGGNHAVIEMQDPERDPIGSCTVFIDGEEIHFDNIYEAYIHIQNIGKDAKEIHYLYDRYIVVNPDIRCVVYTSDSLKECEDYVQDQLNPPEPLLETTRYNVIDTSEEADHPWYVRRYEKIVEDEDEE